MLGSLPASLGDPALIGSGLICVTCFMCRSPIARVVRTTQSKRDAMLHVPALANMDLLAAQGTDAAGTLENPQPSHRRDGAALGHGRSFANSIARCAMQAT